MAPSTGQSADRQRKPGEKAADPAASTGHGLLVLGAAAAGKKTLIARLRAGAASDPSAYDPSITVGARAYGQSLAEGAPPAVAAVILIDGSRGDLQGLNENLYLASLFDLPQVVLAINKLDLLDFDPKRFRELDTACQAMAAARHLRAPALVPISAAQGDNLFQTSAKTPWHRGPSLIEALSAMPAGEHGPGPGEVTAAEAPPQITDQFAAHLLWFGHEPLLPERQYLLRLGAREVTAAVTDLRYRINFETLEHLSAKTLQSGDVAHCNFALDEAVAYDSYKDSPPTGTFLLLDRETGATVAVGLIDFGLRRATNLVWQETVLDKSLRASQKKQRPCVIWLTGLSGAGKSTIANALEGRLHAMGQHTYLLDGDNVRHGLNKDLGFTDADRVENIRRVAEVAKLMSDAGLIVITSFISPFRNERQMARELMADGEFVEIFVDAPLTVCESRDPKGLYEKARAGKIANFTGIDSPYEPPEQADIRLNTDRLTPAEAADLVLAHLRQEGFIGR